MAPQRLFQRATAQQITSPAHRLPAQGQASRQKTALPPYEAPRYPLSQKHQNDLTALASRHDMAKYRKHLTIAIKNMGETTAEAIDRQTAADKSLEGIIKKRKERVDEAPEDGTAAEKAAAATEKAAAAEKEAETRARDLEKRLAKITTDAERELRQLIDFADELAQREQILKAVAEEVAIAAASAPNPIEHDARRKRARLAAVGDDEDDVGGDAGMDGVEASILHEPAPADILSLTELLQQKKDEYAADYTAQSLRRKYASHNDYIGFKRQVHDAQYPGDNAPPVPAVSTWFPEAKRGLSAASRTVNGTTSNPAAQELSDNDSDDDLQIAGAVTSLRCPLTLQTFRHPFSNSKCPHTYERDAIVEYWNANAASELQPSQAPRRRNQPAPDTISPRFITCLEPGCSARLELGDFYDDQILARKVKRQQQAEREKEGDEEGDTQLQKGVGAVTIESSQILDVDEDD